MRKRGYLARLLAAVLLAALSMNGCMPAAGLDGDDLYGMTDIENHWGREAAVYCLENGYMSGVGGGMFCPDSTVTRVQVAQVLYNMAGSPDTAGMASPFTDVAGHWGEKAVVWAYNTGITTGIGAQSFAPNTVILREQAAVMFKSFWEHESGRPAEGYTAYLSRFTDRGLISSWAEEGLGWAVSYGLMSGMGDGKIAPKSTCTRAQLARIIKSYYEPAAPEGPGEDPGTDPEPPAQTPGNSPLVSCTILSPNNSGRRNHKIDTITIHCMAEDWTVEQCGRRFADPKYGASSNYGVGSDGRIALYVNEGDRSWATSSPSNDHRAVTIEVANIGGAPLWPVSQQAYYSLIDLITDICRRNGIERLLWQGDKNLIGQVDKQNMTVHRWFSSKSCPGEYLYNHHGDIAAQVNRRLLGLDTADSILLAARLL